MQRRDFLKVASTSAVLGTFNLSNGAELNKHKSVIQIFLAGGASGYETFYANPGGIEKARSTTGFVQTKTPGIYFGGNYTNLSAISDKLTVINSFGHNDASHSSATFYVNTGMVIGDRTDNAQPDFPSRGSLVSSVVGPTKNNGMPTYTAINRLYSDNVAWLSKTYAPYESSGDSIRNLTIKVEKDRFDARKELLYGFSRTELNDRNGFANAWNGFQEQTYNMLTGNIKEVFDINKESEKVRLKYGKTKIGDDCLLASRLVENGGVFISIVSTGWDNHEKIQERQNIIDPPLDKALASLIEDIHNKGLQNDVLIVVSTEFSRTLVNSNFGRDHASNFTGLLLSGGRYIGGSIGKHDDKLQSVISKKYSSSDLSVTIYDHLGIDYSSVQRIDSAGRPRYLVSDGASLIL